MLSLMTTRGRHLYLTTGGTDAIATYLEMFTIYPNILGPISMILTQDIHFLHIFCQDKLNLKDWEYDNNPKAHHINIFSVLCT